MIKPCAEALLAVLEEKRMKLEAYERRGERLVEVRKALEEAGREVRKAGAALTKSRKAAASRLAAAVTAGLRGLGFQKATFGISLEPAEPAAHGCDRVVYMFGPNPGEAARPLAAIASSGEIARVMLALKGVLAAHDSTDVMVFDEIDANIGGETARIVGAKMREVAAHHQVVAITHLPQSAAYGERHFVVSKQVAGGRTRTSVSEVSVGLTPDAFRNCSGVNTPRHTRQ